MVASVRVRHVAVVATIGCAGGALAVAGLQESPHGEAGQSLAITLITTDVPIPSEEQHLADAAPTAAELTTVLISAVDPDNSLDVRQSFVERGPEATDVLERIASRAGKMMRIVKPRVIDPIEFSDGEATGRLQASLRGGSGPVTPLSLTFKNIDGRWTLSARSVCDVASFNGFVCPPGYPD